MTQKIELREKKRNGSVRLFSLLIFSALTTTTTLLFPSSSTCTSFPDKLGHLGHYVDPLISMEKVRDFRHRIASSLSPPLQLQQQLPSSFHRDLLLRNVSNPLHANQGWNKRRFPLQHSKINNSPSRANYTHSIPKHLIIKDEETSFSFEKDRNINLNQFGIKLSTNNININKNETSLIQKNIISNHSSFLLHRDMLDESLLAEAEAEQERRKGEIEEATAGGETNNNNNNNNNNNKKRIRKIFRKEDGTVGGRGALIRTVEKTTETEFKERMNVSLIGGFLKREVWTIPLLAIAFINIFLISLFEIYVLCKARTSRSNIFLGQFLLFGLFLCSSLALTFAICPSVAGCYVARVGVGVAFSLVFAVLMVKCIFLLSLESGLYFSATYQATLLFFSVLVQVVLSVQSIIISPPPDFKASAGGPLWTQCGTSLLSLSSVTLSYNVFLIVVVGFLAIKTRGVRENFRESTYIGFSILITIPIWCAWIISGWILQGRHLDGCIGFGLNAQSLATFLIMFVPKGRQLAAMGKEGLYIEDQEEQCSAGSFFHFKPSKTYKSALIGEGNVYTTLEPTISTINPNVFFHRTDFHPGMIY